MENASSNYISWLCSIRQEGLDRPSCHFRSVAQPGSASGLGPEGREFESLHSDQLINSTMSKKLIFGDYLVIGPLAWVMSQSILYGGLFWGIVALVMFNQYVARRVEWQ